MGEDTMLRKLAPILSLGLLAALAAAPAVSAQDKITGDYDLDWNTCWPGPQDEVPDWVGTVDIDGDVHDLIFFILGDGRPPGQDPPEGSLAFIEIWAVYDGLAIAYDEECAVESFQGELLMWGHDAGMSDLEAQEYAMTGYVAEAFGDYADLAGKDVVMSGTFTLDDEGNFLTAPGAFEIG
jgi:hypothetical protein